MENKERIFFGVMIGLIALLIISGIVLNCILIKKLGETKEPEPLIKEYPMCHMPRDCFESEEEYLDQFPGKEVPEILYECLVYCHN